MTGAFDVFELKCDQRIPTGAVKTKSDWPGTFIRGDDAATLRGSLRYVLRHWPKRTGNHSTQYIDEQNKAKIQRLHDLLQASFIEDAWPFSDGRGNNSVLEEDNGEDKRA